MARRREIVQDTALLSGLQQRVQLRDKLLLGGPFLDSGSCLFIGLSGRSDFGGKVANEIIASKGNLVEISDANGQPMTFGKSSLS